jgi:predicted  nucleic acid-binding Zn-ribbon protein
MEKVEKIDKSWNFFKRISDAYYNWKKRNEQLQQFLDNSTEQEKTLTSINRSIDRMNSSINHLNDKMGGIEKNLKTVSEGTKMELFDTLHTWRGILVV